MTSDKCVLVLTDYRGTFYSTIRNVLTQCSFDVARLAKEFELLGYTPIVRQFTQLDFRKDNFAELPVVYQSSEDEGLAYKSFIEDVLLAVRLKGGILLPSFECFRAHHNKVFMEFLRDTWPTDSIKNITSKCYGTLEEFSQAGGQEFPMVVKAAAGAASAGVRLARTKGEALRIIRQFSSSSNRMQVARELLRRMIRKDYVPRSLHRQKFITQNLVPRLSEDFKVLVYGPKYYVVKRRNRKNDFRASGSGLISWPEDAPCHILNAARKMYQAFNVPCASLDIAFDGNKSYLLEMQFLMFGPMAMEHSQWHFTFSQGQWQRVDGPSVPEVEFATCVVDYLERSGFCPKIEHGATG